MANKIDSTQPPNSASPTLGAQDIRELSAEVNALLTVEHDISDDATTSGFHGEQVTMKETAAIATPPANYGRTGVKEANSVGEFHYRDESGNEKQITKAGQLNIVDADGAVVKTGAQTIAGVKTFAPDSPIVPDLTAGDNTTKAANSKFVTAAVAAASDPAYTGDESHTFNGGLIMKMGNIARTGTSTPVSFDVPFATIVSVTISTVNPSTVSSSSTLDSVSASGFTIKSGSSPASFYWTAIGF